MCVCVCVCVRGLESKALSLPLSNTNGVETYR